MVFKSINGLMRGGVGKDINNGDPLLEGETKTTVETAKGWRGEPNSLPPSRSGPRSRVVEKGGRVRKKRKKLRKNSKKPAIPKSNYRKPTEEERKARQDRREGARRKTRKKGYCRYGNPVDYGGAAELEGNRSNEKYPEKGEGGKKQLGTSDG